VVHSPPSTFTELLNGWELGKVAAVLAVVIYVAHMYMLRLGKKRCRREEECRIKFCQVHLETQILEVVNHVYSSEAGR